MSMKFLRGCFVAYCNFAKSNEGRFPAGDRILGKVLMTIRRPSLQCGHLVWSNPVSLKMRSEAVGYSGDMDSLFVFFGGAETVRKAASDFSTCGRNRIFFYLSVAFVNTTTYRPL
jgi:hypothetical protein